MEAVKRIGRYLVGTKDKGLIINPKKNSFDCWVDASHASEWSNKTAIDDPNTARSRMGYVICHAKPYKAHCKVFENNEGAIEIAEMPKMRPRTKHLNIKYYHFKEEVSKGTVSIYHLKMEDQMADMLTKPLDQKLFEVHREKMMVL